MSKDTVHKIAKVSESIAYTQGYWAGYRAALRDRQDVKEIVKPRPQGAPHGR